MNAPVAVPTRALSPSALAVLGALRALPRTPGVLLDVWPLAVGASLSADPSTVRRALDQLAAAELIVIAERSKKGRPARLGFTPSGLAFELPASRAVACETRASTAPPHGGGGGYARTTSLPSSSSDVSRPTSEKDETKTETHRPRILGVDLWLEHTGPDWIRAGASAEAVLRLLPDPPHPRSYRQYRPERVRACLHSLAWSLAKPGAFPIMEPAKVFVASCRHEDRKLRDLSDIGAEAFLREFVGKAGYTLPRWLEVGYGELCHELGYVSRTGQPKSTPTRPTPTSAPPVAPTPSAPAVDFARVKARAVEIGRAIRWAAHFEAQRACKGAASTDDALHRLDEEARSMGWEGGS